MQEHIERCVTDYWSTKSDDPDYAIIRNTMSKNRFKQLNRYFQIHNTTQDNMTPFDKLREISNHLQHISLELWEPATMLAIDEGMIPFDGRSAFITFIPNKPVNTGFKLWMISQLGYSLGWFFHAAGQAKGKGGPVGVTRIKELKDNWTAMVVPELVEKLPNWKGKYHVFIDNLFTSEKLLSYCTKIGIGVTGTARKNSGVHESLLQLWESERNKDNQANKWGTMRSVYVRNGIVSQAAFKDNSVVLLQSNTMDCSKLVTVSRKRPKMTSRKAKTARAPFGENHTKDLPIPEAIDYYNKNMNHVDIGDQFRASMPGRREYKNWRALFFKGMLSISIVNSYLLSRFSDINADAKYESHTRFRKDLAVQLLQIKARLPPKTLEPALAKSIQGTQWDHEWGKLKQRQCGYCRLQAKKARSILGPLSANRKIEKPPRVKHGCKKCKINLCKRSPKDCWDNWHGGLDKA